MKPNPRRPCFGRRAPYQAAMDATEANVSCVTVAPLYIYLIIDISFIADLGDYRPQPLYLLGCSLIPTPDLGFKTPTSTPSCTLILPSSASLEFIEPSDPPHLFAYHSTSHVTLVIRDIPVFLVASDVPRIAYQIGRLPFICKGCRLLSPIFQKSYILLPSCACARVIVHGL